VYADWTISVAVREHIKSTGDNPPTSQDGKDFTGGFTGLHCIVFCKIW